MSARRHTEAAHSVIDRLTEQLVDAKERARMFEAAHRELPVVKAALADALADRDAGTSPRVRDLEATVERLNEEVNGARVWVAEIYDRWNKVVSWAADKMDAVGSARIEALVQMMGDDFTVLGYVSRDHVKTNKGAHIIEKSRRRKSEARERSELAAGWIKSPD